MPEPDVILRFDDFEVDLAAGELRRAGVRIRLQEQPWRVLVVLLERAGQVVTREELRARLWPSDTFVDFDHSLNIAVSKLRDALDDRAASPQYIETVPRRGYVSPPRWSRSQPRLSVSADSLPQRLWRQSFRFPDGSGGR